MGGQYHCKGCELEITEQHHGGRWQCLKQITGDNIQGLDIPLIDLLTQIYEGISIWLARLELPSLLPSQCPASNLGMSAPDELISHFVSSCDILSGETIIPM